MEGKLAQAPCPTQEFAEIVVDFGTCLQESSPLHAPTPSLVNDCMDAHALIPIQLYPYMFKAYVVVTIPDPGVISSAALRQLSKP